MDRRALGRAFGVGSEVCPVVAGLRTPFGIYRYVGKQLASVRPAQLGELMTVAEGGRPESGSVFLGAPGAAGVALPCRTR